MEVKLRTNIESHRQRFLSVLVLLRDFNRIRVPVRAAVCGYVHTVENRACYWNAFVVQTLPMMHCSMTWSFDALLIHSFGYLIPDAYLDSGERIGECRHLPRLQVAVTSSIRLTRVLALSVWNGSDTPAAWHGSGSWHPMKGMSRCWCQFPMPV